MSASPPFYLAPFVALAALLSGCAYTAPYRVTPLARAALLDDPRQSVVLTVSATEHRPGMRRAFFKDTRRVLADLPDQPGLLGYSFRFELLGDEAWTLTAWRDEAARDAFVRSPAHLTAMRNSTRTAQNLRFISLNVPLESLPMSWTEVRARLAVETPRPPRTVE